MLYLRQNRWWSQWPNHFQLLHRTKWSMLLLWTVCLGIQQWSVSGTGHEHLLCQLRLHDERPVLNPTPTCRKNIKVVSVVQYHTDRVLPLDGHCFTLVLCKHNGLGHVQQTDAHILHYEIGYGVSIPYLCVGRRKRSLPEAKVFVEIPRAFWKKVKVLRFDHLFRAILHHNGSWIPELDVPLQVI